MLIGLRANEHTAGRREGMLTVTLTWALFSLLGMLPFYLGGYIDNVTDAYFETMSGFTTTGSTILTDIEALPHGILFWRSLTQWQGGRDSGYHARTFPSACYPGGQAPVGSLFVPDHYPYWSFMGGANGLV